MAYEAIIKKSVILGTAGIVTVALARLLEAVPAYKYYGFRTSAVERLRLNSTCGSQPT